MTAKTTNERGGVESLSSFIFRNNSSKCQERENDFRFLFQRKTSSTEEESTINIDGSEKPRPTNISPDLRKGSQVKSSQVAFFRLRLLGWSLKRCLFASALRPRCVDSFLQRLFDRHQIGHLSEDAHQEEGMKNGQRNGPLWA